MALDAPAFDDISAARDCPCPGCAQERLELRASGGSRAGTRAAAVLALGAVLTGAGTGAAHAMAQPSFATQNPLPPGQGAPGPLFAQAAAARTASASTPMRLTRSQILARAQTWVDARVSYSMSGYYQGYRKDCSGFVSMAWGLGSNQWTGSLAAYGVRITKSQLKPGDMLLFHNPANPGAGSHVTIFGGWADSSKTRYVAYEQTRPHTLKRTTPYAYWNHSGSYVPYRYKYVADGGGSGGGTGGGSGGGSASFPGASAFGPGASGSQVTRLGKMLVERGAGRFYSVGPGPRWSDADRRATKAFQEAQGWRGSEADGIPGPATWRYLVEGKGRDIGGGTSGGSGGGSGGSGSSGSSSAAFPGKQHFRPGQSNAHVTKLGKQLVKKGYGKHYAQGPGPRWSESDRRNVESFQRAQGWRGADADGYPGPETWRRLFR
ncbi:peptidoglycan-binding protein [Streptomyces sp. NPDC041068]|uniref:peptidoglycan-binding protein n=1 Tax=Streptomyces sp. NPDC041068 TaxID=3155130 RepID=UPI0033F0D3E8